MPIQLFVSEILSRITEAYTVAPSPLQHGTRYRLPHDHHKQPQLTHSPQQEGGGITNPLSALICLEALLRGFRVAGRVVLPVTRRLRASDLPP